MSDGIRPAYHNGRKGKHGVYTAKHIDRDFDIDKAEHINSEKTSENKYWHTYQEVYPDLSFDMAEKMFYIKHFTDHLNVLNDKAIASRHKDRIKDIDNLRRSPRTCPKESLLYFGNKDYCAPADVLWEAWCKQAIWEEKTFPQIKFLGFALHVDEQGAPHIQARRAFLYKNEDGNWEPNEKQCLRQMGIGLDTKGTRYDNPTKEYSKMCREHWLEVCNELAQEHGLTLDLSPPDPDKGGLSLDEYKAQQEAVKRNIEQFKAAEMEKAKKEIERFKGSEMDKVNEELETYREDEEERIDEEIWDYKVKRKKDLTDEKLKREVINELVLDEDLQRNAKALVIQGLQGKRDSFIEQAEIRLKQFETGFKQSFGKFSNIVERYLSTESEIKWWEHLKTKIVKGSEKIISSNAEFAETKISNAFEKAVSNINNASFDDVNQQDNQDDYEIGG